MRIVLAGADRQVLQDRYDLDVVTWPERQVVARARDVKGHARLAYEFAPTKTYRVQVFPMRHRDVSQTFLGVVPMVTLYAPAKPERVTGVEFTIETGMPTDDTLHSACFLNIRAAMLAYCRWDLVGTITRIRRDRLFAEVDPSLRDWVKSSMDFGPVSGALHTPPPGFHAAGSFKHRAFSSGVLQLTFFASDDAPLRYIADIDIDEADGLRHVFEVLDHKVTGGQTHPYDIHQILTFHHRLDPGYRLVV